MNGLFPWKGASLPKEMNHLPTTGYVSFRGVEHFHCCWFHCSFFGIQKVEAHRVNAQSPQLSIGISGKGWGVTLPTSTLAACEILTLFTQTVKSCEAKKNTQEHLEPKKTSTTPSYWFKNRCSSVIYTFPNIKVTFIAKRHYFRQQISEPKPKCWPFLFAKKKWQQIAESNGNEFICEKKLSGAPPGWDSLNWSTVSHQDHLHHTQGSLHWAHQRFFHPELLAENGKNHTPKRCSFMIFSSFLGKFCRRSGLSTFLHVKKRSQAWKKNRHPEPWPTKWSGTTWQELWSHGNRKTFKHPLVFWCRLPASSCTE